MRKFATVLLSGVLLASVRRQSGPGQTPRGAGGTQGIHLQRPGGPPAPGDQLYAGACNTPTAVCGRHGPARRVGRADARPSDEPRGDLRTSSQGGLRRRDRPLDGKVYQLTWQSNKAYVYDARTGEKLKEFRYPGEGWGLTTDGKKLYMSDGTANIYTLDPTTFKREKAHHGDAPGRDAQLPQRAGVDRRQDMGQRLHHRPNRHHRPGDGRGGGIVDLTGCCPKRT